MNPHSPSSCSPAARRLAAALLTLALASGQTAFAVNTTGQLNTYNGSLAANGLTTGANWSAGTPASSSGAGAYADLLFTTAPTDSVLTGTGGATNINAESYNVTNGSAYTLQLNATTSGLFRVGSTSNTGTSEVSLPFTNSVSGVAQDLIFLSNGSDLTFNATNSAPATPLTTFQVRQAGNFNIGTGSVLTFNTAISGNFAVTINGAGTTVLNAATSSTAATTINGGTLQYGVANALGSGAVNIAGGTLALGAFSDTVGAVTLSSGSITGAGTLTGTSYAVTGSGTINASLAGSGGLTITSSAGTLSLGGTNTYSGATFANYAGGGALVATSTGALSANSQYRTASSAANAGTLELGVAGSYQMASLQLGSILSVVAPETGAATLTFANGGFQTGSTAKTVETEANATVVFGSSVGVGTLDLVGSTAGADRNIILRGAGDIVVNSVIQDNASGAAAGFKGGVEKTGVGTLTLNAANTYTLGTSVSAGTLRVNNATGSGTGSGPVSVTGGTLGGSGIIFGPVTIAAGAFLAPGNSPGNLTLNNGLALDGTYAWEINANSAVTGFDSVTVTGGDIILGGSSVFDISPLAGVDFTDAFWSTNQSWTVFSNTGSGSISGSFFGLSGSVSNAHGAFSLAYGVGAGADVTLNWTASVIPEPSAFAAFAGVAALGLTALRRRRA